MTDNGPIAGAGRRTISPGKPRQATYLFVGTPYITGPRASGGTFLPSLSYLFIAPGNDRYDRRMDLKWKEMKKTDLPETALELGLRDDVRVVYTLKE